ncbi:sarcosine oxidase subunit alpha family protein [Jannaschia donghaensis]|uniref:Aminomethyltransferase n=1 Tax=Jannaschia donghaensis TaxID=420998 RepID=A0A0M6YKS0_9RHOB|nr:sarcosine oxidase subunit alpha family protein [Jannaschia donghaensis]CTQ50494.1 Aminomethyltransferase [Jannaschia donghaensis]
MSGYRLDQGGTGIDRSRPLRFTFDGRRFDGYEGDTLASALMAEGVDVLARSFKYHRPRGIVSAGSEEPSALVTLRDGARSEPNAKAPMIPLWDGLVASGQNAWPSLRFDAMAVNGLAGPLFGAGFYYKTFMGGPRGTWTKFFEPIIRRAAGMGKASLAPDPDRYETAHLHCDVLVIGAGPAGLAAARAAAGTGARVVIADEGERFGGHLLSDAGEIEGQPSAAFAAAAQADLAALPWVTALPRTTVYGHYDGQFAAVERVADHVAAPGRAPRQRHWLIRPLQIVLAAGATERPIVFPGNDRPGVMLAEAARTYATRWGVAPGRRVVVFTTHDGAYRTVRDLHAAGVGIAAVIDARPQVSAEACAVVAATGARHKTGATVCATRGRSRLTGITLTGGLRIDCDTLAVSGGWMPNLHLTSQGGGKPVWSEDQASFLPGTLPDRWQIAGSVGGLGALTETFAQGAEAGIRAAAACDFDAAPAEPTLARDDLVPTDPLPLWRVPGKGKAFVDLQHDVTADDVMLAQREGFEAVEHLKRYTTLGMAADQGKTSNLNGLALMAEARGIPVPQAGTTRYRPPYTPVALGALAGAETGAHLAPVRRTPMHDWHAAHGALWVAAGQWMRPRAYLRDGETIRDAYIREARAVRAGVGIVDVSPLGKIEVAGPDAAEFLNRVYVNGFARLPVGRARYGIMLREDGIVLDDGTTWRLEEHRFLMTTTTANAGRVLTHLEVLLATAWPDLRVRLTSVTEQWAGMAVAGPKSRDVLAGLIADVDFATHTLPFMGIARGTLGGVPVTVARLSFSGELAYEVFCGAHHGAGVWAAIMAAGEAHGIVPYGTEALGALRIEKGHISGAELDGRTTVHDLGFAGFASTKKAYVGSAMMHRPALTDGARPRLVGLRSRSGAPIRPGAHLVGSDGRPQGHVTSTTFSPELDAEIALALLRNGPDRMGEHLDAAYPLKDESVPVEVVSPHFVDPEGDRLRA